MPSERSQPRGCRRTARPDDVGVERRRAPARGGRGAPARRGSPPAGRASRRRTGSGRSLKTYDRPSGLGLGNVGRESADQPSVGRAAGPAVGDEAVVGARAGRRRSRRGWPARGGEPEGLHRDAEGAAAMARRRRDRSRPHRALDDGERRRAARDVDRVGDPPRRRVDARDLAVRAAGHPHAVRADGDRARTARPGRSRSRCRWRGRSGRRCRPGGSRPTPRRRRRRCRPGRSRR